MHVDLIAGLPGEDDGVFRRGFDRLVALGPHEIQVGILKRLRGTPIVRHEQAGRLRFIAQPPYEVRRNRHDEHRRTQAIKLMARFHDLVANSAVACRAWLRW